MEKRIEELEKRIKRLENVMLLDVTEENFIDAMQRLGGHEVSIRQLISYFRNEMDWMHTWQQLEEMADKLVKEQKLVLVGSAVQTLGPHGDKSVPVIEHCYSLP